MPEVISGGVTSSGIPWTVERDTPDEANARSTISFAQFCGVYSDVDYGYVREFAEDPDRFNPDRQYAIGFALRTRVPDSIGRFGSDAEGAAWCSPDEWHRLYYLARKSANPAMFPDSP